MYNELTNGKKGSLLKALRAIMLINLLMLPITFSLWVEYIIKNTSAYYIDIYPDESTRPTITLMAKKIVKNNETYVIFNKPLVFILHNSSSEPRYIERVFWHSIILFIAWFANACVVLITWHYYRILKNTVH